MNIALKKFYEAYKLNFRYYFIPMIYFITKSLFYYLGGLDNLTYLGAFTGRHSFVIEILPLYLIAIYKILNRGTYSMFCRYNSRIDIFKNYYKQASKYTILYLTSIYLIIFIFMLGFYKIHDINIIIVTLINYVIHLIIYLIILSSYLYIIQFNISSNYSSIYLYIFFVIENYVLFEGIFSKKIPLIITWIDFDGVSLIFKIIILLIIKNIIYVLSYNKALEREFI